MKKTTFLSGILAASFMTLGAFGCSHNEPDTATPATVNSQNMQPSTAAPTEAASPTDERQNVNGVDPKGTMQPQPVPMDPSQQKPAPDKSDPATNVPSPGGAGGTGGAGAGSGGSGN